MRLTLLGTGSALPSPTRLQTGAIVERGGDTFLVDCGSGITHRLAQSAIDYREVDTVLLTHTHLDHVADLPTLAKARLLDGHEAFTVVGPQGTSDVCNALFAVDDLTDRLDLSVRELPEGTDPFTIGEVSIKRALTDHSKPGYAYRFDEQVTIAGDTTPTEPVCSLADGSAVLVHECAYPDETVSPGHSTPTALGKLLADVDVDCILLTHLFPETEPYADELANTVSVATDQTSVTLD
ncbi:MBL fold metallo-hydrolase [Halorubrum ezzemoulense]|uniref:MBL fold metallo-hydrolase n=1 Tax=Halorubrum ezzemoulense TaxID=337243 RepID=UPI002330BC15|nr:MBL fold metallo-hydrolase [Halorubrum ezzemoulense]MDB9281512.1 MBL fold metallo-hydrolase [Halorubrum ezzemoulense]MDB9285042.1 MBL fold metallo-hydrolase [Halorubrum ezzemoulense]